MTPRTHTIENIRFHWFKEPAANLFKLWERRLDIFFIAVVVIGIVGGIAVNIRLHNYENIYVIQN